MKLWLQHFAAALAAYGPWGIFLLSVLDSFGIPLPAAMDVLLIGVAAASAKNPSHAWFAATLAVLGSVAGNVGLFLAAQRGAHWLRKSEPPPGKRKRFREWFDRYGLLTVFVPAVTPIVPLPLKVFVVSAAAMRTPFSRFLIVIVAARCIRFYGQVWLGLALGKDAQTLLARHGWAMAGMALALGVVAYLIVRIRSNKGVPAL